ncbi:MAG: lamin tail domain-containing protein, partial [Verrucomicrobiales bacterium]|nr:lamin tail domain-containing protein [Verrucomicrobiales bacterium]
EKARVVASTNYAGAPTSAQEFLRIVEIMYHPAPPTGESSFATEDFEFLQVKNFGPATLNLAGVRFTGGIDFTFPINGGYLLPAGESALVVKNPAAFVFRYGAGFNIVGPYAGNLENQGENLRLEDASGEKVLDFDYDNTWQPMSDGGGFSLVILEETTPWNSWGEQARWGISAIAGGSPAQGLPGLAQWKAAQFSPDELTNDSISGEAADPDFDGRSNLEEFISGTDPRNAASYLKIEVEKHGSGPPTALTIRFAAVLGKTYSIQYLDSLPNAAWQKHSDIWANAETRMVEVPVEPGRGEAGRYFRVVTPAAPE